MASHRALEPSSGAGSPCWEENGCADWGKCTSNSMNFEFWIERILHVSLKQVSCERPWWFIKDYLPHGVMVCSSSSLLPQWKRSIPKGTTGALARSPLLELEEGVREGVAWPRKELPVAGGSERELDRRGRETPHKFKDSASYTYLNFTYLPSPTFFLSIIICAWAVVGSSSNSIYGLVPEWSVILHWVSVITGCTFLTVLPSQLVPPTSPSSASPFSGLGGST